jgi:acyl-CoA thioester hydrolase
MAHRFTMGFTADAEHIDELGHVNNAVWVRWMEEIATAHWQADGRPQDVERYAWVVTRHEIDYRGNVTAGAEVTAVTEIREPPTGARFDRHVTFSDAAGRELVRARTTWAMIDRATGRLMRVPADVAEPFLPDQASASSSDSAS